MDRKFEMNEGVTDTDSHEHEMTRIINRLQSLANHAGDMRAQVESVADRMFGSEPTAVSGVNPSDKMSGDINQITECLSLLGGRMTDLQAQIQRIENL